MADDVAPWPALGWLEGDDVVASCEVRLVERPDGTSYYAVTGVGFDLPYSVLTGSAEVVVHDER